jgi:hypothetical protein
MVSLLMLASILNPMKLHGIIAATLITEIYEKWLTG